MFETAKKHSSNRRITVKALASALAMAALPVRSFAAARNAVIATGIDASFSAFPVAATQGFMTSHNVDLTLRTFEFGGIALDALLTHDAQIGSSSPVTAMTRWDRGGRLYTVGALSTSSTTYGVTASARVSKPEDLYGKAVAFPGLSSGQYFYEAFLKKYNLDGSKIQTRSLAPAEALVALQRGDVDAFFTWEPWNSRAAMTVKGAHTLAVSQDVGLDFVMYLYFSDQLVADKTLAQDVMGGLIEASNWVTKNPGPTVDVLNKSFHMPKADSAKQLQGLKFDMSMHQKPVVADFNDFAEFALRTKMIKARPDWNEMMRPEIMKAVAPELVSGWSS